MKSDPSNMSKCLNEFRDVFRPLSSSHNRSGNGRHGGRQSSINLQRHCCPTTLPDVIEREPKVPIELMMRGFLFQKRVYHPEQYRSEEHTSELPSRRHV